MTQDESVLNPVSLQSLNKPCKTTLVKPFKVPFVRLTGRDERGSEKVLRKRKRVDYREANENFSGLAGENIASVYALDGAYSDCNEYHRKLAAALLENDLRRKFPVFGVKEKDVVLKKVFVVPKANKDETDFRRIPPALGVRKQPDFLARALHDPCDEFSIVLYDPTIPDPLEKSLQEQEAAAEKAQQLKQSSPSKPVRKTLAQILGITGPNDKETKPKPKVAVVIDPKLAKVLRPHQVEGVKFLYKCVTGRIDPCAHGCIMADEMGLGKTLQCITLLWTLLKQSPIAGKPEITKCVIACPSSLVRNWANELVKWLGKDALTPLAVDGKMAKTELQQALQSWTVASGRNVVRPVLIISYESLRLNVASLKGHEIGLLLCDEGHRLKNGESQTFTALDSIQVEKRVILSGTPIQNDLSEYFSLISFANPGLLGSRHEFRKSWEIPILRGRDADSTEEDRAKGDTKLSELASIVNKFIIRRTNDILSKYLPVKYEHVVFCKLSPFQAALYRHFISSPENKALIRGKGSQPLKAIGILKKLCNHPDLLDLHEDIPGCEASFPEDYISRAERTGKSRETNMDLSGKMRILERMLARIRADTNDKIVLISNYTQTLDLLQRMCQKKRYGFLRLDGTMGVNKRQKLVDRFNDPDGQEIIFLLSSKAGGCGINLIGANRLILFDPDWNPAADQQALARVWRDGQKKDCFVYRFIATGTIEEKIFQRQSHKQSLSSCVVDEAQDAERHFSLNDMKQLFEFNGPGSSESGSSTKTTICDTHDTFKCKRCRNNKQFVRAPAYLYGDTNTWNHFSNESLAKIEDLLLRQEGGLEDVTFCFQYISH